MSSSALAARTLREEPDLRRSLGARGERMAERYLARRGFRIRSRAFRTRFGEIDLVAEDGRELVFVEVKTRSAGDAWDPREAISVSKRRRIVRAAAGYLRMTGEWDRPCRFDCVAIRIHRGEKTEIEHIRDAFRADD